MVDQYEVLGLQAGADKATVRAAYRQLARQLHPDVNRSPDASDRMRRINEAYGSLSNDPRSSSEIVPAVHAPAAAGSARGASTWSAPTGRYRDLGSVPYVPAGAGAVAVVGGNNHTMTIGMAAGFFVLVAVLAAWAVMVVRPFSGVTAMPQPAVSVSTPTQSTLQSSTSTLASQASANAAANAAAARSNVRSLGASGASGASGTLGTRDVASAPTVGQDAPHASAAIAVVEAAPAASGAPEVPVSKSTLAPASPGSPATAAPTAQAPAQRPSTMPSLPALQSPANTGQHIQAINSPPAGDAPTVAASAKRALSGYDKAWTGYASALRFATAGSMMSASASVRAGNVNAAQFLSGDAQVTMARSLYLQQQIAWNGQASAALVTPAASGAAESAPPKPDTARAVRAELRLRQAAELVAQAQTSGTPAPSAQVKSLLDEAEQFHREWVAEWATHLKALGS